MSTPLWSLSLVIFAWPATHATMLMYTKINPPRSFKKKSRNQGAWACGLILKLYDNPTPPTHFFLFPYPFISKCFFVLVFSLFMEFTGFLLWRHSHFSFHCCHAWNTTHKKLWGKKFVNIFRIISQVMYAWLSTTGCRMPFNIVLMEKKTNLYYWQWA